MPVRLNKRPGNSGVTLVEVMMALLVLLVVSLALMQTALVSIESNMKTVLRDEAVSIAEARIGEARGAAGSTASFDALRSDTDMGYTDSVNLTVAHCGQKFVNDFPGNMGVYVTRSLKKIQGFGFCTYLNTPSLGVENKEVVVTVAWVWKGEPYTHTNSTVLRRP